MTLGEFRDRLLWALSEPRGGTPGAALLEVDAGAALVVVDGKTPLWLMTHDEHDGTEAAEVRVRGALATARGESVHIALVGPDSSVDPAMQRGAKAGTKVLRGLHRVTPDGLVHQVSGTSLASLSAAATRASRHDGPPATELAATLVQRRGTSRSNAAQAQAFVERVRSGRPVVTWAIVAVCVVMFLLELYWGGGTDGLGLSFARMGAGNGELLRAGEWWRVLSPAFLHGSFAHIAMNSMALLAFGPLLEVMLGPRRYIALYILSAFGGHLASALVRPEVWSVGASAGVWGLMCAGLALFLRPGTLVPPVVAARMKKQIWTPVLLNGAISFIPGIDFAAHLGGGVAGFLLVYSGLLTRGLTSTDRLEKRSPFVDLAAGVVVIAAVASVAAAFTHGRPWELRTGPTLERRAIADTGVSVLMPASLAESQRASDDNTVTRVYGNIDRDPVVIQVTVATVDEAVPEEALELRVQGLARELAQSAGIGGAEVVDAARVEQVGTRPFATVQQKTAQGVRIRLWATAQDTREVLVVGLARNEAADAWKKVADRLADSLQFEPRR